MICIKPKLTPSSLTDIQKKSTDVFLFPEFAIYKYYALIRINSV